MKTAVILCDWAEQINGKLYMQGGEWSSTAADRPVQFAVALIVRVPWTATNQKHTLLVRLVDADGSPYKDTRIEGDFEMGRPVGVPSGAELSFCAAFNFGGFQFDPGRYTFEVSIDDTIVDSVSLNAVAGK